MRRLRNLPILLLFLATPAAAQIPRVVSISAAPNGQHLAGTAQLADLFSPKIVSTIRSGLPAVIRFDFRLVEAPDREVQRAARSRRILYDLWSERYYIRFNHRQQIVGSFSEVEKICTNFEEAELLLLSGLSSHKTYRLRLQVTVFPISTKQDQQFREWIESSGIPEESSPGEDPAAGFRFNLSKLFSFFLGKKDRPFGASEWATSPPFRVENGNYKR
jgi:hypothetical protein